jgi:hypothetical protein
MQEFKSKEEAFASQNYDPSKVKMEGVPEHIVAAALAFVNLAVAHDAVNPEFVPDYENYDQYKYENCHEVGSPSGVGFRFDCADRWFAYSGVGSRLVSESRKAAELIAKICNDDYTAMKVYDRSLKK